MSEAVAWIGAIIAGTAAGLIPFFIARSRHNSALAWGALFGCIVAGVLGGAVIAAPASVVLTIVALTKPATAGERRPLNYWTIAIPAGLLLCLAALGLVAMSLPANYISGKITVPIVVISMFLGGYVASAVTWFANRETVKTETDDISSRISSIGSSTSENDKEG